MPPFYNVGPEHGLHILKDSWGQKKFHEIQSKALSDGLETAIAATFEAAHVRDQGFKLLRPMTLDIAESQEERQLESAIMARWSSPNMASIRGAWQRMVAFQVPLFGDRDRSSWGYIDLLGVNPQGLPVVVELKKSPTALAEGTTANSETPLRMLLEAAAYAVALRRNWSEGFRAEWIERLRGPDIPNAIIETVPLELVEVPLVAAAPASFWLDWLPYTSKGQSMNGWTEFKGLLANLKLHHLPLSFVSISGSASRPESLAVQPLSSLPWSP